MKYTRTVILLLGVVTTNILPAAPVFASEFVSILEISGSDIGSMSGEDLIEMLYILAISFAALIAVVQLVIAGFQYITSEVVTSKEGAKKRIYAAVIGLLIILAAVALLRAIDPGIANLPSLTQPPRPDIQQPRAETVRDPQTNQRTLDGLQASEAERRAFIESCQGEVVIVGGQLQCRGEENPDAVINTTERFDELFAESGIDQSRYDEMLSQWNQYVANLEPPDVTEEEIKSEFGATEVLFAVKRPTVVTQSLAGYESQQEALCNDLGGQIVTSGDIIACVR